MTREPLTRRDAVARLWLRLGVRFGLIEDAGCYDEPTRAQVAYEDEWRSDAARPLYMIPRPEATSDTGKGGGS